jgi:hypothetical protein
MQFGKTIIGAIIGAALGIGLLVVANLVFHLDAVWLAIPVGILTGLGVRTLVSTSGHASYLRGAITGLLALAAFLGGQHVVKFVATNFATPKTKAPVVASSDAADATDEDADATGAEPTPPPVRPELPVSSVDTGRRGPVAKQFSTLDFIWLCVAALVAYELGRGTGPKPDAAPRDEPAPSDVPQGTHPDA